MMKPPASISSDVAANGSAGIWRRAERNEPVAHITAEQKQSATPHHFAPPDGCASTATPAKPTPTPASTCHGRCSCVSRSTATQSGTEAMINDASPVGTSRSAKKRIEFAPGSRQPITRHASSARRGTRSDPPRANTTAAMIAPDAMNRVDAANITGIVRPA